MVGRDVPRVSRGVEAGRRGTKRGQQGRGCDVLEDYVINLLVGSG